MSSHLFSYSLFDSCPLQPLLALLLDYSSSPPALPLASSGEGPQAGITAAAPPPISWQQAGTLHCTSALWSAILLLPKSMLCPSTGMLKLAVPRSRLSSLATPLSLVTPGILRAAILPSRATLDSPQHTFCLCFGVCSHGCPTQCVQCLLPQYSLQVGQ